MLSCITARFSVKANLLLSELTKGIEYNLNLSHTRIRIIYSDDGTDPRSSKPALNSCALILFLLELPAAKNPSSAPLAALTQMNRWTYAREN
jgi:hypothetical protein